MIEKSNRGRKAKETDKYVIESDAKIEESAGLSGLTADQVKEFYKY